MHLHLTQPKCLLPGGSHQAMPTYAKKPSVFIYFVEVRSNRQSSEPQDIFGSETEKKKRILFKLLWIKGISSLLYIPYWLELNNFPFYLGRKTSTHSREKLVTLGEKEQAPPTLNEEVRVCLLSTHCMSGSRMDPWHLEKVGTNFVFRDLRTQWPEWRERSGPKREINFGSQNALFQLVLPFSDFIILRYVIVCWAWTHMEFSMSTCTSNVQTKVLTVVISASGARDLLTLWVSLHFKKLFTMNTT